MIIAVDFDGTIVEHKYPEIGKEMPFAIDTLKRLAAEHNKIILWSVREGKLLDDAVEYCRKPWRSARSADSSSTPSTAIIRRMASSAKGTSASLLPTYTLTTETLVVFLIGALYIG